MTLPWEENLLLLGGIAGASMSYIWTFFGKLVVDIIERQAAMENKDIMPLVYLVIGTTTVELVMMILNTCARKKFDLGRSYIRLCIAKERIAKVLGMEYETLETPDMLDRLQKAKRATAKKKQRHTWFYAGYANYDDAVHLHNCGGEHYLNA